MTPALNAVLGLIPLLMLAAATLGHRKGLRAPTERPVVVKPGPENARLAKLCEEAASDRDTWSKHALATASVECGPSRDYYLGRADSHRNEAVDFRLIAKKLTAVE